MTDTLKDAATSERDRRRCAGTWLRELREHRGLSQRELAQLVGYKYYTFVSQVEHGAVKLPSEDMEKWALALKQNKREFTMRYISFCDPVLVGLIGVMTKKGLRVDEA
ncbi:MAG: helix-turn-helix transcriptional regulator [Rhodospirillaceae bacterium]|nr:helix-turn-helix transcriptional regulator [Rhodospirillales bacterium]